MALFGLFTTAGAIEKQYKKLDGEELAQDIVKPVKRGKK